jgi:hypothetical protein
VIGEYLARIHEEVRGRPRYLVQDRSQPAGPPATIPEHWTSAAEVVPVVTVPPR